ncbi:hypothetical protein [Methylobacterium sp. J-068]|uniref:hypothetical protein n=1 Tax=Methylobacterium sp. J-068 TaxID=2836649 RepID=UPI001FB9199C|nr:hypothetical protein [Methylobacterium sp. J-068]MCJ2036931.1 hypothetical protein [Methylobacterium sp. J-068]
MVAADLAPRGLLTPRDLLAAPASRTVAVIGAPGQDMTGLAARAGGSILRMGGRSHVIVVTAGPSDLVAPLYASGARLVADAGFASGCDPVSQSQRL